jgi:hypothetical protein
MQFSTGYVIGFLLITGHAGDQIMRCEAGWFLQGKGPAGKKFLL